MIDLKPDDTELLDEVQEKPKKEKKKKSNSEKKKIKIDPRYIPYIALGVCIIFGLVVRFVVETKNFAASLDENYSSVETRWVEAFSRGDLDTCDTFVANKDKLNSYNMQESRTYNYYNYAITQLGMSIESIEVKDVSYDETKRADVYTIEVSYKPFKVVTELNTDIEDVSDYAEVKKAYVEGTLSETEMQSKLAELYQSIFEATCFEKEDTIQTEVLVLSREIVDGVTYVRGTVSFVNAFLSDSNLQTNITIYENQINQTIKDIIKNTDTDQTEQTNNEQEES